MGSRLGRRRLVLLLFWCCLQFVVFGEFMEILSMRRRARKQHSSRHCNGSGRRFGSVFGLFYLILLLCAPKKKRAPRMMLVLPDSRKWYSQITPTSSTDSTLAQPTLYTIYALQILASGCSNLVLDWNVVRSGPTTPFQNKEKTKTIDVMCGTMTTTPNAACLTQCFLC